MSGDIKPVLSVTEFKKHVAWWSSLRCATNFILLSAWERVCEESLLPLKDGILKDLWKKYKSVKDYLLFFAWH